MCWGGAQGVIHRLSVQVCKTDLYSIEYTYYGKTKIFENYIYET